MANRAARKTDYLVLFTFLALLLAVGLTVLASASSDLGKVDFDNPYYYLKDQLIFGIGIGALGFAVGYFFNYHNYRKLATPLLIANIILLLLVFTPLGISSGGAQRWLPVGPLTIQPSELMKLVIVIYLAAWLSSAKSPREHSFSEGLVPFLSIIGFVCLILLFQNSTSAAVIIGLAAVAMYFAAGARVSFVGLIGLLGALALALFIVSTPYRLERLQSFIDPSQDVQGSSYQANQALTVIGSGGMFGVGYGQSRAKSFLPERMGDSIFAIIAEEFGFVGVLVVIGLFFTLVTRTIILAKRSRDKLGKLILIGCASVIAIQAFLHIGSASGLVPTTGVPLPFISYGNFSIAVFMIMVGVILNVQRNS